RFKESALLAFQRCLIFLEPFSAEAGKRGLNLELLERGSGLEYAEESWRCRGPSPRREIKSELNKNPVEGFSAGLIDDNDLYRWEVLIIGPPDTLYEGGVFKAHLTFPKDYPLRPPKMKFITEIWHPNVDKNGDVCISILHEPGEDKYGYEKPEERWLPIHTVETIMISVISMLADPNGDSPANVDAAKEWREDRNGEFKRKVARCVRKSQETAFE
uniref:Ubiquitin-conjugating enzyme E2 G1 n=1 Tax=Pseudonaja textilis TaxID=8673 RepID=A0A670Y7C5_PSETE